MKRFAPLLAAVLLAIAAAPAQACRGSFVHYQPAPVSDPALRSLPWVRDGSTIGLLFYYSAGVPWSKRKLERLRVYAHGKVPSRNLNMKVLWVHKTASPTLALRGLKLDGHGSFRAALSGVSHDQYPSIVDIPKRGCWRLSIASSRFTVSVL